MTAVGAPSIDELVQDLAALRRENERLRVRIEAIEHASAPIAVSAAPDMPGRGPADSLSRRALMRRGGVATLVGLGAAVGAGLASSMPVEAAADLVLGAQNNAATSPTGLQVNDDNIGTHEYGLGVTDHGLGQFPESAGIAGHANGEYDNAVLGYHEHGGVGVRGIAQPDRTAQGIGVSGTSDGFGGIGVQGSADGDAGQGVVGSAIAGVGVVGTSGDTNGVIIEFAGAGVGGFSKAGTGMAGYSRTGVGVVGLGAIGGYFVGHREQISLEPGTHVTHPIKGERGDLYVDKSGRLWYCRTGGAHATWHQLA